MTESGFFSKCAFFNVSSLFLSLLYVNNRKKVHLFVILQKMPAKQKVSFIRSLLEVEKAVVEILDVLGLLFNLNYAEVMSIG